MYYIKTAKYFSFTVAPWENCFVFPSFYEYTKTYITYFVITNNNAFFHFFFQCPFFLPSYMVCLTLVLIFVILNCLWTLSSFLVFSILSERQLFHYLFEQSYRLFQYYPMYRSILRPGKTIEPLSPFVFSLMYSLFDVCIFHTLFQRQVILWFLHPAHTAAVQYFLIEIYSPTKVALNVTE